MEANELVHWGVKGMRWGVRRSTYEERQAGRASQAKTLRKKADSIRENKPNTIINRGLARNAERKANAKDLRSIGAKNLHDYGGAVKTLATKGVNRENIAKLKETNREYHANLVNKYKSMAERARNAKNASFVDKMDAKYYDRAARVSSFNERAVKRSMQRTLKQPVDKWTKDDKKLLAESVALAITYVGAVTLIDRATS